jgi:hypothetical protein
MGNLSSLMWFNFSDFFTPWVIILLYGLTFLSASNFATLYVKKERGRRYNKGKVNGTVRVWKTH